MKPEKFTKQYPLTEKEAFVSPAKNDADMWPKPGELYQTGKMEMSKEDREALYQQQIAVHHIDYKGYGGKKKDSVLKQMADIQPKLEDARMRMQGIIAKGGAPIGKPLIMGTGGSPEGDSSALKDLFYRPGESPFKWHEMPEPKFTNHSLFLDMGKAGKDYDADKVLKMYKEAGVMMFKEENLRFSQRNGYMFGSYPRKMLLLI